MPGVAGVEGSSSADHTGNAVRCERLVEQVLSGNEAEREQACSALVEHCILPAAKQIAQRRCFSKQPKKDFLDAAAGHVFEKLSQFDPAKASFAAWCYRVLKNLAIDLGKKTQRRRELAFSVLEDESGAEFEIADSVRGGLEALLEGDLVLSARQREVLESDPPLGRVILVAAAGLAPAVEEGVWNGWLAEAGVEPPFPPLEMYDEVDPTKRLPILAEALNMQADAVRQHWYRRRTTLRKLFDE